MRVAYLINQYPQISHSFIRREIAALERQGFVIDRIAIRGWDDELVDDDDRAERARTRYVLEDGPAALLFAVIRVMLSRPSVFTSTVALTWHMSRRAERPLVVQFIYLAEACRILTWLKASPVAHLHAHFGTNSAQVAMLVHSLGGPRWSFTVHGPEEFDKAPIISLARKIRRCGFVVAISSYGRSQIYRMVPREQWDKVKVVHCGLEPTSFQLAAGCPISAARRLVCVGRLCEQKGQLILIEAMRQLLSRGVEVELTLVGDGEMRSVIEAMVGRYGLQGKVRITGWLAGAAVRQEMVAARALVLPSFAEGLPVVLMEAMALGRPVISTFVAGIPELVQPGENGWLVPAGDVEALTQAMQECLEASSEQLAAMGAAAHHRAWSRHQVGVEAAKLGHLFKAAAKAGG